MFTPSSIVILSCVSDALHLDPYSRACLFSTVGGGGRGWDSLVPEGGRKHSDVHPPSGLSSFLGRCSLASVRAAGLSDNSRHKDKKVACYVYVCVCTYTALNNVCLFGVGQASAWKFFRSVLFFFFCFVLFYFCAWNEKRKRAFFFLNWSFSGGKNGALLER